MLSKTAVIASNNPGKLKEFQKILSFLKIVPISELISQFDVEETGSTYQENALLKAKAAYEATGLPSIADDSGIEVEALDGKPGVFSSRFFGKTLTDEEKQQHLLALINEKVPPGELLHKRAAAFHSTICYYDPSRLDSPLFGEGDLNGRIALSPRGSQGFGYDPIFEIDPHSKELSPFFSKRNPGAFPTLAELSPFEKNEISHRKRALDDLHSKLISLNFKVSP